MIAQNKKILFKLSGGFSTLTITIVTALVLIAVLFALLAITLFSVRLANTNLSQQSSSYAAEGALYSTIVQIVESNLKWPPGNNYTDEIDWPDRHKIKRHITFADNKYSIDVTAFGSRSARRLLGQIATIKLDSYPLDVFMAIDTSGSMDDVSGENCDKSTGPKCQPLEDTREAARLIVDLAAASGLDVQFSLYSFGSWAERKQALTNDLSSVKNSIDNLRVGDTGDTFTNIGDGFYQLQNEVLNNGRENSIKFAILLSDGVGNRRGSKSSLNSCVSDPYEHTPCTNDEYEDSPIFRANDLKGTLYTIYTIGLGIDGLNDDSKDCTSEPCGERNVARDTLKRSASGGANYYEAPNSKELNSVFTQIFDEIQTSPALLIDELEPE